MGQGQRRLSAAHFETILENIQDAVVVTDPDGVVLYLNRSAKRLYGFDERSGEELESLNLQRYALDTFEELTLGGERLEDGDRPLVRALRGEAYTDVELLVRHKDHAQGRVLVFSGRGVEGEPQLNVLTIRDETDRWRSERRYRTSFETDPAPTIVVRLQDGVILDANAGMSEMTGTGMKDLIGAPISSLDLFPSTDGAERIIESLRSGHLVQKQRTTLRDAAGRELEVILSARSIEINGQSSAIFTFLDITELERTRRERLDALEALARARSRLSAQREQERASLANDLHDDVLQYLLALNAEIGLDQQDFAREGYAEAAEAALRYREKVLHSAMQLRRTIRGFRPGDLRAVGLWVSLKEALPDLRWVSKTEVVLPNEPNPDLPEEILLLFYRVAYEAIFNALKHAEASRVCVTVDLARGEAVLQIEDNGRGFEMPQHLAEFERENHFGLISMEERVAAHGGTLEIESVEGRGTLIRCRVEVPLERRAA